MTNSDNVPDRNRILAAMEGKIVSARFIKRDGSLRQMNGRLGVRSKLKGGTKAFSDEDKRLVTCYDMTKNAYRSFSIDRLVSLTISGTSHIFKDAEETEELMQQESAAGKYG